MSPEIESAVFEIDWRSAAGQGLPTDQWQTLVLLPPSQEDVPASASPQEDGFLGVMETMTKAVSAKGTIVVLDSDPALTALAHRSGRAVITVAAPSVPAGAFASGHHISVRAGQIVHEHSGVSEQLLPLAEVASAEPVEPTAVLAAVAAATSLGVLPSAIRAGLTVM